VEEVVCPNEMILKYGWDIYSEKPTSFCQMFLQKAQLTVPDVWKNKPTHWMGFVAPWINYKMSRKRNEVLQRCRTKWESE
jgi:hypothetical protein